MGSFLFFGAGHNGGVAAEVLDGQLAEHAFFAQLGDGGADGVAEGHGVVVKAHGDDHVVGFFGFVDHSRNIS